MPIVQFHLVAGSHGDEAIGRLLVAASELYVDILYPDASPPPLERVRAFATMVDPWHWATAGRLVADGGAPAPYFTCLALAGRPLEQHERLLEGMTILVEEHLGIARSLVRGQVIPIEPTDWGIGGAPASRIRTAEIAARATRD